LSEPEESSWRRTLVAMATVQFIIGAAFSVVPPVLPLLLPELGAGSPESLRTWAGIIIGVAPLTAALTSTRWGRLTSRIDARLIILIACVTAAICTASMAIATSPAQLTVLRFAMGLFGGHVAAGLAIISQATPIARLGYALGWAAAAQLAGMLLGPLLGGLIADLSGSLRAPFIAAGLSIVLITPAIFTVPRSRPTRQSEPVAQDSSASRGTAREVKTLVIALLMAQCAIMSLQPIVTLQVQALVGDRPELATLSGLAFSILACGGIIASPMLGRVNDAFGARKVLLGATTIASLLTLAQALAPSYRLFVGVRFVAGLFVAAIIPTINVLIGRKVQGADRGHAYGLSAGSAFLGAFLGPAGGGLIAAHFGLTSVFVVSGALLGAGALWIGMRLPAVDLH
jgi:DHA1 family multidrug resistance protein-like MFS transporter